MARNFNRLRGAIDAERQRKGRFLLEVDLILEFSRERWAIEVKLTTHPSSDDILRLEKAAALIGAHQRFLVSQTVASGQGEHTASCNLPWLLERLAQLP